jgi:hypothetical protein
MTTLLWDVRSALEEKEANMMQDIINKNKNKDSYYVQVCANWTTNACDEMKTTYILRSEEPPKMLGSKLYKIDNKKGSIIKEWELPMDVLVPEQDLDIHNQSETVHESVKSIAPVIQVS